MFEAGLRAALIEWLRSDPALDGQLNAITEEAPLRTAAPWLGIVASASSDWSTKTVRGREIRVALELHLRGDATETGSAIVSAIEDRIESFPKLQPSFAVASTQFLRARAEKRANNLRAILIEYRFRLLESS